MVNRHHASILHRYVDMGPQSIDVKTFEKKLEKR